ncbi:hypothetical protein [Maritimibacter sp. 55A14]|uniref:hypothetical protein n=1 Tax=Maritimibacter sp. 55A14 TaxID=2174844 RepID=UPI0011B28ABD|nr:hypothetical protein [Maritimibacter sp. 55A14]
MLLGRSVKFILFGLNFVCVIAAASAALAQDEYKNGCDPLNAYQCYEIAEAYASHSSDPIPFDLTRSAALADMARKAADEGCREGRTGDCIVLIDVTFGTIILPAAQIERQAEALKTLEATAGFGCIAGSPIECGLYQQILPNKLSIELAASHRTGRTPASIIEDFKTNTDLAQRMYRMVALQAIPGSRRQCENGDARVCGQLADLLRSTGDSAPFSELIDMYLKACIAGFQSDCDSAESLILSPRRSASDDQEVVASVQEQIAEVVSLCSRGHAPVCLIAEHVVEPSTSSRGYREKACDLGYALACRESGAKHFRRYRKTSSTDEMDQAIHYLTRACKLDDIYACHILEHARES